jgi:hypothetical protein
MKKKGIRRGNIRHRKMRLYRKISGLLILAMLTVTLSARENNCIINKTYPVRQGTSLRLSNKYGDINIITVKHDSISVCATITIIQDDDLLIQKNIKLVTINIEKLKDTIYVSTVYDKSFFSETSRKGRKSFSVDYLIKLPAYMDLNIVDEFGNVSVDELSGILNVKLSQGDLTAKRLIRGNVKPVNSINVDHGNITIDELNWMNMTVHNCPSINVGKAQALMITSTISKIKAEEIGSLVCNSKSDGYIIKSINNIITESVYSAFDIGLLNSQLKSKAIYGSITVSGLNKWFSSIDIVSDQTPVSIKTGTDTSFCTDIVATDALVEFPFGKYPGIIKTENNFSTTLLGIAGIGKETKSVIRIRTTSGKLTIQ